MNRSLDLHKSETVWHVACTIFIYFIIYLDYLIKSNYDVFDVPKLCAIQILLKLIRANNTYSISQ